MKKSPNHPSKHRKLVLRHEAIVVLMPPQLAKAAGAGGDCTYYSTCPPDNTEA